MKKHLSTAEPKIGFCSVAIAEHLRQELDIGGLSTAAASATWVFFSEMGLSELHLIIVTIGEIIGI
jgi:hypothetical protein